MFKKLTSFALLCALGLLLISFTIESHQKNKINITTNISQLYKDALQQTKKAILKSQNELAKNSNFRHSLASSQSHAINAQLNYVKSNYNLDNLTLFTQECTLITTSTSLTKSSFNCPLASIKSDVFYYLRQIVGSSTKIIG